MKKRLFWFFLWALLSFIFSYNLFASELTFRFTSPSFGGDPLYGTFLLQQAQLQNKFKEKPSFLYQPKSLLDRFSEFFTNQLIYRMADIMLDQIFGEDGTLPTEKQTYTIGNFRISFDPITKSDFYIFTIEDLSTGQTTAIEIPKMIQNL